MLGRKNEFEERIIAIEKLLKSLMDECSEIKEMVEEIGIMLDLTKQ